MVTASLVEPRIRAVPPAIRSLGGEAVDLCRQAGLELDPWQEMVLVESLGLRADDKWAAFEVGIVVPRQNGKGAILEARELVALFLTHDQLTIHSAHQFDTSMEAFLRLLSLIEESGLDSQVRKVTRSHGEEGITLKNGCRIRFRTRTKGGGRGFSCDTLILDEAMFLPEFAHGALLPTLSARKNPQVIYAGSAVDQEVHEHGVVLARIRERGIGGDDPSLAYFEWSLDVKHPADITDEMAVDEEIWGSVNPAVPFRISLEHIGHEQRSMDARTFAVERLNAGDWPRIDGEMGTVIGIEEWDALKQEQSLLCDPVVLAFDVSPDRTATIAAAGRNEEGFWHIEVLEHHSGTGWMARRLAELAETHSPVDIVCDGYGPSASLMHAAEEAGVTVTSVTANEHAQACGLLSDAVAEDALRHLGSEELRKAIKGAATRPLGDAWAWSRKASNVDISPLVASTLALWAAMQQPDISGDPVIW